MLQHFSSTSTSLIPLFMKKFRPGVASAVNHLLEFRKRPLLLKILCERLLLKLAQQLQS